MQLDVEPISHDAAAIRMKGRVNLIAAAGFRCDMVTHVVRQGNAHIVVDLGARHSGKPAE